mgnify:FL=1
MAVVMLIVRVRSASGGSSLARSGNRVGSRGGGCCSQGTGCSNASRIRSVANIMAVVVGGKVTVAVVVMMRDIVEVIFVEVI